MFLQTKLGKFIIIAIFAGPLATYALVCEAMDAFSKSQATAAALIQTL